jgi:hypothetical protein
MLELTCAIVCVCVPTLRPLTSHSRKSTRNIRSSRYLRQPPDDDADLEGQTAVGRVLSDLCKSVDRSTVRQELELLPPNTPPRALVARGDSNFDVGRNGSSVADDDSSFDHIELPTVLSPPPRQGTDGSAVSLPVLIEAVESHNAPKNEK